MPSDRTSAEYRAQCSEALRQMRLGEPASLPSASTNEELLVLLEFAAQEAKQLNRLITQALGATCEPRIDVSGLSVEEKIALGEEASRKLYCAAYTHAPEMVLDGLDKTLGSDAASSQAAGRLLERMRQRP